MSLGENPTIDYSLVCDSVSSLNCFKPTEKSKPSLEIKEMLFIMRNDSLLNRNSTTISLILICYGGIYFGSYR